MFGGVDAAVLPELPPDFPPELGVADVVEVIPELPPELFMNIMTTTTTITPMMTHQYFLRKTITPEEPVSPALGSE